MIIYWYLGLHIVVDQNISKPTVLPSPYPPPQLSLSCHIAIKLEHLICFINDMWVEMMVGQLLVKALRDTKGFWLVFTLLPLQNNMPHANVRRRQT